MNDLRKFGALVLSGIAFLFAIVSPEVVAKDGFGMRCFYVALFLWGPLSASYVCLLNRDVQESEGRFPLTNVIVGVVTLIAGAMGFYILYDIAGTAVRVVLGSGLILVIAMTYYTRVHRDWSSKSIPTPFGRVTLGRLLRGLIGGFFMLFIEVVFALIVGGVSGGSFGGGGGSFSGGGASGDW